MKIAVLSDIHGNCDALIQVLADLDSVRPDRMVCLGDCIGYGPEPQQVIDILLSRNIPTILGNHEMAAVDPTQLKWFNPNARRSLELSLPMLNPSALSFIQSLPTSLVMEGCRCVHGFPPDSTLVYLFQKSDFELMTAFNQMAERICFVGHTHDLEIVTLEGHKVDRWPLPPGITQLHPGDRHIINVGSVGQPRDGTHQAKYVVWHPDDHTIDIRSIDYDIDAVAAKILAAGLPEEHARRLG